MRVKEIHQNSPKKTRVNHIVHIVVGMWLSLVERSVRDADVAGSNPVIPTIIRSEFLSSQRRFYFPQIHKKKIISRKVREGRKELFYKKNFSLRSLRALREILLFQNTLWQISKHICLRVMRQTLQP